ncbi:MAG: alpha/beta hydrolase [Methanoregula sp.]|jgi:hypothetical protein
MNTPLADELLLIKGKNSFLLAGLIKDRFPLCIETFQDEYCQGVFPGDVVVVSAPEGGPVEPAMMLLELIRKYHLPLLVLPKDHPGSKRISYVVSVGPSVTTNSTICRGTHPEQHLVCSAGELSGITITGTTDGITFSTLPPGIIPKQIKNEPLPVIFT